MLGVFPISRRVADERKIFRSDLKVYEEVNMMGRMARLTANEGRYLALIYRKQNEELSRVGTTSLARNFGVQPPTVTEMLSKLADRGLLKYVRYHGIELTDEGIRVAQGLLRRHRLLEVLLVRALNYSVQGACAEASKIDHYTSEDVINRICRRYGHPRTCPCNKTILHVSGCGGD